MNFQILLVSGRLNFLSDEDLVEITDSHENDNGNDVVTNEANIRASRFLC